MYNVRVYGSSVPTCSLQIKMPKCDFYGLPFDVAVFHHVPWSLVYAGLQHRLRALLMCNCVHIELCVRTHKVVQSSSALGDHNS